MRDVKLRLRHGKLLLSLSTALSDGLIGVPEHGFSNELEVLVDNATLEQFTGICDKNGVEIYEGDIVRAEHSNYYDEHEEEPIYEPWIGKVFFKGSSYHINDSYSPTLDNVRIKSLEVIYR